ncbi:uncharacterized protein METZ01_LOCUS350635 [marine metagenome]|uniref:Uncharacterized protein n=1 Tax=marine metagenome TaxID=408172 RepID=A0A382RMD9_9ZZZZ
MKTEYAQAKFQTKNKFAHKSYRIALLKAEWLN